MNEETLAATPSQPFNPNPNFLAPLYFFLENASIFSKILKKNSYQPPPRYSTTIKHTPAQPSNSKRRSGIPVGRREHQQSPCPLTKCRCLARAWRNWSIWMSACARRYSQGLAACSSRFHGGSSSMLCALPKSTMTLLACRPNSISLVTG